MIKTFGLLPFLLLISCAVFADYHVGAWKTDISPEENEALQSCLGGYGAPFSRCGSTDIRDPITARVLSISDGDDHVIFAVIDTVGIGDSLIAEIKQRVFTLSGGMINKQAIQLVATHTHAGPDLQGLWGGISEAYRERIVDKVAFSILFAHFTALPSDISALTLVDKAKVNNRRGWDTVNDDINLLDFKLKNTNFRIATLTNMSAHPTILDATNTAYSAGFIHFLRKRLEQALGGHAIFINGVVGDAAPTVNNKGEYKTVKRYGKKTAKKIINNIEHAKPVNGEFTFQTIHFTHPVSNPGVIAAVQAGLLDLALDDAFNVTTQFSLISFGDDVSAILFPGEALTRLADPILAAMDSRHQFFFGLSDNSLGYFIPSDEFLMIEGRNTEESASLDGFIGDRIQAAILESLE